MDENVLRCLKGLDLPTLEKEVFPIYRKVLDAKIAELTKDILASRLRFQETLGQTDNERVRAINEILEMKVSLKLKDEKVEPVEKSPLDILDVAFTPLGRGVISFDEIQQVSNMLNKLSRGGKKLISCLIGMNGVFSIFVTNIYGKPPGSTVLHKILDSTSDEFVFRLSDSFGSVKFSRGGYNLTVYQEGLARFRNRTNRVDYFIGITPVEDKDLLATIRDIASRK
jgi:hypothetical protein